jgi:hypothetical protein
MAAGGRRRLANRLDDISLKPKASALCGRVLTEPRFWATTIREVPSMSVKKARIGSRCGAETQASSRWSQWRSARVTDDFCAPVSP